ncbi:MAG: glycosyltransferase [Pseudomonadota bacterium]
MAEEPLFRSALLPNGCWLAPVRWHLNPVIVFGHYRNSLQFLMKSSQITILHVIAHLEKGGAEKQVRLLAESSEHEHVIAVLAGNERECAASIVTIPNLAPRAIYRTIAQAIATHKADIVQLWLPPRLTLPAAWAARAADKPIISGDRRKPRTYGLNAVKDRLGYIVHILADAIVPNYPFLPPRLSLRRMSRMGRKIHVIPNGLDLAIRPVPDPVMRPDRLLFVGRLVEQKRVDRMLGAVARGGLKTRLEGVDIVGEGPLLDALKARVSASGLDKLVTFHGYLSDWHEHFSPNTHALVLPSASEGMSNTLFEAIGQGFVPIVTRSRELDVILAEWSAKPVFIETLTEAAIEAAIAQALQSDGRDLATRVSAMQSHLTQFSVSAMAQSYDRLYASLLSERGGTP